MRQIASKAAEAISRLRSQRLIRFGIIGAVATGAYYLLGLLFVYYWHFPILAGNALAYAISFVVSYLGQSLWTFQATSGHRHMLPRFAIAQIAGLGINTAIIKYLHKLGSPYAVSMLAAILIVPVCVYLLCKYWVFASTRKSGNEQS